MKKSTIIMAVIEATVLLIMKLMDWKETKTQKPAAAKARQAAGHRVVNPAPQDYNERPPTGDPDAANILAGESAPDEEVHKTTGWKL